MGEAFMPGAGGKKVQQITSAGSTTRTLVLNGVEFEPKQVYLVTTTIGRRTARNNWIGSFVYDNGLVNYPFYYQYYPATYEVHLYSWPNLTYSYSNGVLTLNSGSDTIDFDANYKIVLVG